MRRRRNEEEEWKPICNRVIFASGEKQQNCDFVQIAVKIWKGKKSESEWERGLKRKFWRFYCVVSPHEMVWRSRTIAWSEKKITYFFYFSSSNASEAQKKAYRRQSHEKSPLNEEELSWRQGCHLAFFRNSMAIQPFSKWM